MIRLIHVKMLIFCNGPVYTFLDDAYTILLPNRQVMYKVFQIKKNTHMTMKSNDNSRI